MDQTPPLEGMLLSQTTKRMAVLRDDEPTAVLYEAIGQRAVLQGLAHNDTIGNARE